MPHPQVHVKPVVVRWKCKAGQRDADVASRMVHGGNGQCTFAVAKDGSWNRNAREGIHPDSVRRLAKPKVDQTSRQGGINTQWQAKKKTAKNHDYIMNRIKPNLKPGKVHSVIHGQNFDADVGPGCSAYKQTKPGKNIGNGVKSGASLLRHIIRTPNASQPFVPLPHHLHALCMFSSILYPCGTAARILEKPSKIPSRRDLPDNRLSVAFNIRGSQECWKWTREPAIVEGSNSTFQSTQFEPMLRMRDKARENRGTMPENASSMREFELMRVVI